MQGFAVSKCKLAPAIISGHLSIFTAFVYFQSAFIFVQSAFIFFQRALFKFSKCESAPIYFLQVGVSAINFHLPKHHSAIALFLDHAVDYF
jgi:hypothetical protein